MARYQTRGGYGSCFLLGPALNLRSDCGERSMPVRYRWHPFAIIALPARKSILAITSALR